MFSLLGLGGASVTAVLMRYRHAFLALTFVSLGISFYLNYIKTHTHIVSRIIFWISVMLTAAIMSYAYGLV